MYHVRRPGLLNKLLSYRVPLILPPSRTVFQLFLTSLLTQLCLKLNLCTKAKITHNKCSMILIKIIYQTIFIFLISSVFYSLIGTIFYIFNSKSIYYLLFSITTAKYINRSKKWYLKAEKLFYIQSSKSSSGSIPPAMSRATKSSSSKQPFTNSSSFSPPSSFTSRALSQTGF